MLIQRYMDGVLLAVGFVSIALLLGMGTVLRQRKTYAGFLQWTLAALSVGVGVELIAMRGRLPDLVSIIVGNLAILASLVLIHDGLSLFVGRRPRRGPYLVAFASLLFPYLYLTYVDPLVRVRIVVSSVIYVLYSANVLVLYFRQVAPHYRRNWLVPVGFLIEMGLFVGYVVHNLRIPGPLVGFLSTGSTGAMLVVALFSTAILIIIGLIVLNAQRTEQTLRAAIDEVKTLRGIVPICASCKRIRDDKGYWSAVETYIQEHTEAEFSHGLCPDCTARLYPELYGQDREHQRDLDPDEG